VDRGEGEGDTPPTPGMGLGGTPEGLDHSPETEFFAWNGVFCCLK